MSTPVFAQRAELSACGSEQERSTAGLVAHIPYRGCSIVFPLYPNSPPEGFRASELRVLDKHGVDVTCQLLFEFAGCVPANGEAIKEALQAIDELVGPLE